jgi:hypothetical protein
MDVLIARFLIYFLCSTSFTSSADKDDEASTLVEEGDV